MDGEAGWWTTSRNIGLPPLARVMGVGRQQHNNLLHFHIFIQVYSVVQSVLKNVCVCVYIYIFFIREGKDIFKYACVQIDFYRFNYISSVTVSISHAKHSRFLGLVSVGTARSFDQTALRPSVIKRIRQIDVKYITHITSLGVTA